jgi:hypothetical protein
LPVRGIFPVQRLVLSDVWRSSSYLYLSRVLRSLSPLNPFGPRLDLLSDCVWSLPPFDLPLDFLPQSASAPTCLGLLLDFVPALTHCPCIGTRNAVFSWVLRVTARSLHRCLHLPAQGTLDLCPAFAMSRRCVLQIAAWFLCCRLRRRRQGSPSRCSLYLAQETGSSRTKQLRICNMNAGYKHRQIC